MPVSDNEAGLASVLGHEIAHQGLFLTSGFHPAAGFSADAQGFVLPVARHSAERMSSLKVLFVLNLVLESFGLDIGISRLLLTFLLSYVPLTFFSPCLKEKEKRRTEPLVELEQKKQKATELEDGRDRGGLYRTETNVQSLFRSQGVSQVSLPTLVLVHSHAYRVCGCRMWERMSAMETGNTSSWNKTANIDFM